MKKMLFAACLLSVAFTACKKDDKSSPEDLLAGKTWYLTSVLAPGGNLELQACALESTMKFSSDDKLTTHAGCSPSYPDYVSPYKLSDDHKDIIVLDSSGAEASRLWDYTITGNTLTFRELIGTDTGMVTYTGK